MKVLYAIQGTGNGHIARAREIVPVLSKMCDLDVLVSGIQADVPLSHPIKYRYKGLSFIFGKRGGVDIWNTFHRNKVRRIWKELRDFPASDYQLIINDFEPISAWAARQAGVRCVSLSHQCAVMASEAPKPNSVDMLGKAVLKHYAPTDEQYGFHFRKYNPDIYTPIIRSEIRRLAVDNHGHYTVYLPAYSDQRIIKSLCCFPEVKWEVFSKHNRSPIKLGNIHIQPISNQGFIQSLANCDGALCGAGFEAPSEALFLGKKVLVVPMRGQYEQHCNAAALKQLGVPVIPTLNRRYHQQIREWLSRPWSVSVDYPNQVEDILGSILR